MSANPLSGQPHRCHIKARIDTQPPTSTPLMSPGCVFPICFCVFSCRYCSSHSQGTGRLEAIFLDQFLLFVDFRATRHGHNCESGPHSSDRTVSICSDQTDDLLSTNQNVFGQISVFAEQKVFGDQLTQIMVQPQQSLQNSKILSRLPYYVIDKAACQQYNS